MATRKRKTPVTALLPRRRGSSADAAPPSLDFSVPPAATAVVKRIEGFQSAPYDDNGQQPGGTWTIGYGSIVDADGRPVSPDTPPISEAQAEALLLRDMQGAARDVQSRVRVTLTTYEAAALISWTYNLPWLRQSEGGPAIDARFCLVTGARPHWVADSRRWASQSG